MSKRKSEPKKARAAKYVGEDHGRFQVNGKPVTPGTIVSEPPDTVEYMLTRSDCELVFIEEEPSRVASPSAEEVEE